jgi:hypothetical protein
LYHVLWVRQLSPLATRLPPSIPIRSPHSCQGHPSADRFQEIASIRANSFACHTSAKSARNSFSCHTYENKGLITPLFATLTKKEGVPPAPFNQNFQIGTNANSSRFSGSGCSVLLPYFLTSLLHCFVCRCIFSPLITRHSSLPQRSQNSAHSFCVSLNEAAPCVIA